MDDDKQQTTMAQMPKGRPKSQYAYPPSPTSPTDSTTGSPFASVALSALEHELADPSNPLIQRERDEENVDPGELIRGLVECKRDWTRSQQHRRQPPPPHFTTTATTLHHHHHHTTLHHFITTTTTTMNDVDDDDKRRLG